MTALRRTIAERMTQSRQQTAPVTLTRRVGRASRLSALRNRWKLRDFSRNPFRHFNDISDETRGRSALGEHPGSWREVARRHGLCLLPGPMDIGVAVDSANKA